jgi:hypothetical protein
MIFFDIGFSSLLLASKKKSLHERPSDRRIERIDPSPKRDSIGTLLLSTKPAVATRAPRCSNVWAYALLMKPITGISPCCARAVSGRTTAAPPAHRKIRAGS